MNSKKAYVYILKCNDNTLYTGYTTDLKKRLLNHNKGVASKYTRGRTPVEYVFTKEFENKNLAMSYESKIKKMTKIKKYKLINGEIKIED